MIVIKRIFLLLLVDASALLHINPDAVCRMRQLLLQY